MPLLKDSVGRMPPVFSLFPVWPDRLSGNNGKPNTKNTDMMKKTIMRIHLAEERIKAYLPKTLDKVMELRARYGSLYNLSEEDFEQVTSYALALNIRDGYCQNIKKRLENDRKDK